jgi:AcrR family transcriptional regulator
MKRPLQATMPEGTTARDRLLPPMAAHVLRHGLNDASLRPLARAAGTSDRMLIYHFGSKEELIAELVAHLAGDFAALLDGLTDAGGFASAEAAVAQVTTAQMRPELADYLRLWLEILAAAARGSSAHRAAGAEILSGLADWLSARLPPEERPGTWAAVARIEGAAVLWSLGLEGRLR